MHLNITPSANGQNNARRTHPIPVMSTTKDSALFGWNSLPGDPWAQPYGLPFFPGEKVGVSFGELRPSFWYEHSCAAVRLVFSYKSARGMVEAKVGDQYRVPVGVVGPDQLCIIPSNLETTLGWARSADVVILWIESAAFDERAAWLTDIMVGDLRPLARRDPYLSQLAQIFLLLCHQVERPDPAFVEGLGLALASRTFLQLFSPITPGAKSRSGLGLEMLAKVDSYIEIHLREAISMGKLAREVGLSPDHFARRFRISTRLSPREYVLKRKAEKARELLESGKYNVSETAEEAGFHDPSHLNRSFWRFFGCSPKTVLKATLPTESYQ
jgi:AraC-like DNA-binding protein